MNEMRNNTFLKLAGMTFLVEAILLYGAVVTTNAALKSVVDWIAECCSYIFEGRHIPMTYFAFIFLTILFRVLFIVRIGSITMNTRKWISPLKRFRTECHHSVIQQFSASRRVKVEEVAVDKSVALSFGFFRPRILISIALCEALNDQELLAILEHEYHHCRKKDALKMLFAYGATRSLFFIPIIKRLQERYFLEKELRADRFAVQSVGLKPLASGLYKLIKLQDEPASSMGTVGADDAVDIRIQALISGATLENHFSVKDWLFSGVSLLGILVLIASIFASMTHV